MHVATILKDKGRAVETARPDTKVMDVARKLAAKRIGAVVVTDQDGAVAGIVSERDVVRALATGGPECVDWPASRIMTRDVLTCGESDTIDHLMGTMTAHRFRHLPVLSDAGLAGIVSIGDVVKAELDQYLGEVDTLQTQVGARP